jgi:hypothetical protein
MKSEGMLFWDNATALKSSKKSNSRSSNKGAVSIEDLILGATRAYILLIYDTATEADGIPEWGDEALSVCRLTSVSLVAHLTSTYWVAVRDTWNKQCRLE